MNNSLKTRLCALLLAFSFFPVFGDTLYFENGSTAEGVLQNIDTSGLQLKTPYGSMNFPKEGIRDISFDEESKALGFFEQKQFSEAVKEYEKLEGAHASDFKGHLFKYKKALCLSKAGQNGSSASLLMDVTRQKDFLFRTSGFFQLEQIYLLQKEPQKALDLLTQMLSELLPDSDKAKTLLERGKIFLQNNQEAKAHENFSSVMEKFSSSPFAKKAKRFLKEMKQEKEWGEILQKIPQEMEKIKAMRWHYQNLLLYNPLIEECETVFQNSGKFETKEQALLIQIDCFQNQAEYKQAGEAQKKYIATLLKYYDQGLFSLSEIRSKLEECVARKNDELSVLFFEALLERKSHDPDFKLDEIFLKYQLVKLYQKSNDTKRFIGAVERMKLSDYAKMTELQKVYCRESWRMLIEYYYHHRQLERCVNAISDALKAIKDEEFYYYTCLLMGYALYYSKNFTEARNVFSIVLKGKPDNPYATPMKQVLEALDKAFAKAEAQKTKTLP